MKSGIETLYFHDIDPAEVVCTHSQVYSKRREAYRQDPHHIPSTEDPKSSTEVRRQPRLRANNRTKANTSQRGRTLAKIAFNGLVRDFSALLCFQIRRRLRTVDWAKKRVAQQQSQGSFRPIAGSIFFYHMV